MKSSCSLLSVLCVVTAGCSWREGAEVAQDEVAWFEAGALADAGPDGNALLALVPPASQEEWTHARARELAPRADTRAEAPALGGDGDVVSNAEGSTAQDDVAEEQAPSPVGPAREISGTPSIELAHALRRAEFATSKECRGAMSEVDLCACLSGYIEPEYPDTYQASCQLAALEVPGVFVLTDRTSTQHLTAESTGGLRRITELYSPGSDGFAIKGARMMRAGALSVLALETEEDSGCNNEWYVGRTHILCALRGGARESRCHRVRTSTTTSSYSYEADRTSSQESRLGFRLTPRGTVKVTKRGKLAHAYLRKQLGEFRL